MPSARNLLYGAVTKGGRGTVAAKGTYLYRRREEVYHKTYVGGGWVGATYMGSPRVFFQKNRVFWGGPRKHTPKQAKMA